MKGDTRLGRKTSELMRVRLCKTITHVLQESCSGYSWSSRLLGYIRARDWNRLYLWSERATTEVYSTAAEHFAVHQIAALFTKSPLTWREFGFDKSPEDRAFEKFNDAERRCQKSNRRFYRLLGGFHSPFSASLEGMRKFILSVLGENPDLRTIYEDCSFGPGSAVGVHGNATNLFRKFYATSWTVTPTAVPYAIGAICSNEQFFRALSPGDEPIKCLDYAHVRESIVSKMRSVSCNKLEFVPKTAKTHRSIAVEPLLNSFLQKGIDVAIRRRLKRWGYDLSLGQSRNAWLARQGSIDQSLGTLDLTSASDCISIALCRLLLPGAWFDLLNRTRSPSYSYRGKTYCYEKFTSMGNGFCFPLETLIFAAAVRQAIAESGCDDRTHAVYGDDLIVPAAAFDRCVTLLRFLGFVPNPAKSFNSGPFRESCGADWYEGQDVRPVYLDYPLVGTSHIMIFHNATLRSDRARLFFDNLRPALRDFVSDGERLMRPELYPVTWDNSLSLLDQKNLNGSFTVELDVFMSSKCARWNKGYQRWSWEEFLYRSQPDSDSGPDFQLARYWAFLLGSPEGEVHLRRKTTRSRVKNR